MMNGAVFAKSAMTLCAVFAVGISGASRAETVTYEMSQLNEPYYLTSTETTIWKNRNLADIGSFLCTVKGGWITKAKPGIGVIYDRTPTSLTVQFQCIDGGCKAVRAYFRQDGANIVARADKAAYVDASFYGTRIADDKFATSLATTDTANGYGAKLIIDTYSVDQIVDALPADADEIVVTGGILQINVSGDTAISTPISGDGGLRFHGPGGMLETQHTFNQYVTTANQTLIEDADVFNIEITSAVFNGGWCGRGEGALPYNVTSNLVDMTMRVQLQKLFTGAGRRGIVVELAQSGSNVLVKAVMARQAGYGQPIGSDVEEWDGYTDVPIATSASAEGYGLESISFRKRSLPTVVLSGAKSWTAGTTADGCRVKVTASQLAANTMARAVNGGVIELCRAGGYDVFPSNVFIAETNSTVIFRASWAINQKDTLKVLGGAVKYDAGFNFYVNKALFTDGATWSGDEPRVGYQRDAHWRTEGEEDINIFSTLRLVADNASRKFTLDTAADIVFHKGLRENASYSGAALVKQGAAKATFVTGGTITGPLQLEGGTVVFGGDAGFGSLVLAGNAAVEVAAGKTLSFGSSSAKEWTPEVQLNFTGEFGSTNHVVRFGTDATGLTSAQRKMISVNGDSCWLDKNGWLRQGVPGLAIVFR